MSLTACAGKETSAGESSAASSPVVAEATANVERYFANNGAAFSLPSVSNPDALKGKTLMYLSAGLSSPAGTAGVTALKEVQRELGFNLVTYDGKFTPSKHQEGLRQAVAQHVDAVILFGVDCAGNEAALREVHAAGIKVIGLNSVDCDATDSGARGMFDAQPLYPTGDKPGRGGDVWAANGAAQADYLIAKLKGDVKVIQFAVPDFAVTASLGKGFKDHMSKCSTCKIVDTVQVKVADFGPGLQQKAEQALLKHPEANAVEIAYDDLVTLGLSAAITGSGRKDSLLTVAGHGYAATMDLIRQGKGLNAGWVTVFEWDHYAGVDTTLRLFSGQKPAVAGTPTMLYDKDHNMPASGGFKPKTDFRSVFDKAWGLK